MNLEEGVLFDYGIKTAPSKVAEADDTFTKANRAGQRGELQVLDLLRKNAAHEDGEKTIVTATVFGADYDWELRFMVPPSGVRPQFLVAVKGNAFVYARWDLVERHIRGKQTDHKGMYLIKAQDLLLAGGDPYVDPDEDKSLLDLKQYDAESYRVDPSAFDIRYQLVGEAQNSNLLSMLDADQSGRVTIEVKTDLQLHQTGNYYSEHERLNKAAHNRRKADIERGVTMSFFTDDDYEPSALMVTTAPVYVVNSGQAGVGLPTHALRKYTEEANSKVSGGDNARSRGCKVPVPELLRIAATAQPPRKPTYVYSNPYGDIEHESSSALDDHPEFAIDEDPPEDWSAEHAYSDEDLDAWEAALEEGITSQPKDTGA